MYEKILVAVDGSEPSIRALHHAMILSGKFGSELILLTVFQKRALPMVSNEEDAEEWSVDPDLCTKYWNSIREYHEKVLESAEQGVKKWNPDQKYTALIVEGHPASQITSVAQSRNVDLIVMGNHSKGGIKEWLLGSTSKRVVDTCKRPVLIVK